MVIFGGYLLIKWFYFEIIIVNASKIAESAFSVIVVLSIGNI